MIERFFKKVKPQKQKAIEEILTTDAEGGPVDSWGYDPKKLLEVAQKLVEARETGVIGRNTLRESFTSESGRQDLLPDTLVVVPDDD